MGPDGKGNSELLTWEELTEPLQQLNLATRCNLVVFVAACVGFAGIKTFRGGPRAPAVALVGPDAPVASSNLLWGTKEFYRRWLDKDPRLAQIAESASREAGTITFEWEPFPVLCYEALIEHLITTIRPAERLLRKGRLRQRMLEETTLSVPEIDSRLAHLPPLPPWADLQQDWDRMFMIDLYPENEKRFGVDMRAIVKAIMVSNDR